jgi:RND family efflux transporter MFP subunit
MVINTYPSDSKLLGITLTLLVTLTACGKPQPEQSTAPQAIPVETQSLVTTQVSESSEFIGEIEAENRVNLAPRVDGRILNILVREGENVSKGQQIVQLQQNREQAEVNAAVSQVNITQADLVNAEAQVKAAEAEESRAEAEVGQAQADLRRQESTVALAKTNIERAKFLAKEGAESKQFLDDRTQALDSAIAERDALKQALEASNKSLIAAQEGVRAAIANVDRQRATLNQAQANVGVASENLDFNRLSAPIDGIVGNIEPQVGDYVEAGTRITTITSNENLTINVAIPIEQASRLRTGLSVAVVSNRNEKPVMGEINFISPTTVQQSVLVKVTVPNNGRLQDAQRVAARVIWSEKPGVLVPTTAISRIAGQNFVFVAEEAQKEGETTEGETTLVAKQKVVQLGAIQGQAYQVLSGLEPGEQVITTGILNLTDGVTVTNEQVSMTEEAGEASSK